MSFSGASNVEWRAKSISLRPVPFALSVASFVFEPVRLEKTSWANSPTVPDKSSRCPKVAEPNMALAKNFRRIYTQEQEIFRFQSRFLQAGADFSRNLISSTAQAM